MFGGSGFVVEGMELLLSYFEFVDFDCVCMFFDIFVDKVCVVEILS